MSDIENIDKSVAVICKGQDKKNDAMMLISPDTNWGHFLTPAPYAIALLGELILISTGIDFSLKEKTPIDRFKLLRYPGSFRASLVQVCNRGYYSFNMAHKDMDSIYRLSGNVDDYVKKAVRVLISGNNMEVQRMIPVYLRNIQDIADKCLKFAMEIENSFIDVVELTGELLEACTNAKGNYDKKQKETEIAIKVAKTERESRQTEIKELERMLANMEEEVKEAQHSFNESIAKIPSGESLLAIAAGETLIEGVRIIATFGNLVKRSVTGNIVTALFSDDDDTQDDTDLKTVLLSNQHKQTIYKQVTSINKHIQLLIEIASGKTNDCNASSPDWERISDGELLRVSQFLDMSRNFVTQQTVSGVLSDRVLKLCDQAISMCHTLHKLSKRTDVQTRNSNALEVVNNTNHLRKEMQTLYAAASKLLGKNPLDNKSPYLSRMSAKSSSSSAVKVATENARYKTELAKATLKYAKLRQETAAAELKASNKKFTKYLRGMTKLDFKDIDFDSILKTLVQCIKALAEVREQWGKLVRFVKMLSSLMNCSLNSSLTEFAKQADTAKKLQTCIMRDVIFEQASKASQIAYIVRIVAESYIKISSDHLMDKITCLGQLVALDPEKDEQEIMIKKIELNNACVLAQKAVCDIIWKDTVEFKIKIDERINEIIEIEKELPFIEPDIEREIQESISAGMEISEDELNDLR